MYSETKKHLYSIPEKQWISHHGIMGQKWGVQNGPPYPLDSDVSTGKRLKESKGLLKKKKKSKEDIKNYKKAAKELKELLRDDYLSDNIDGTIDPNNPPPFSEALSREEIQGLRYILKEHYKYDLPFKDVKNILEKEYNNYYKNKSYDNDYYSLLNRLNNQRAMGEANRAMNEANRAQFMINDILRTHHYMI